MTDLPDNLNGISVHIENELTEWLHDTAKTAENPEQIAALVSGALGGILRFCLEIKTNDQSAFQVGCGLSAGLSALCAQYDHNPEGSSVQ